MDVIRRQLQHLIFCLRVPSITTSASGAYAQHCGLATIRKHWLGSTRCRQRRPRSRDGGTGAPDQSLLRKEVRQPPRSTLNSLTFEISTVTWQQTVYIMGTT